MLDILNGMVGQIWRMLGACRRGCQVKTNSCWQQPALICTFAGRGKRSRVCSFVDWKVLNLPLNVFFLITAGLGLEGAKQLWCRPLSRSLNPLQTYKYVRDSSMHIFFSVYYHCFSFPCQTPKPWGFAVTLWISMHGAVPQSFSTSQHAEHVAGDFSGMKTYLHLGWHFCGWWSEHSQHGIVRDSLRA